MKKVYLITTFLLLGIQLGSSQTLRVGPKLGLNLANLNGPSITTDRSLAGLNVGGFCEVQLIDLVSVQPELSYSVQGASFADANEVYNYLVLPIMGKIYPIEGLYGEFGPQVGFLISGNAKSRTTNERVSRTEVLKTVDFGIGFGAGYRIPDIGLGFGIRYNAGLSNIFTDNSRVKNGVFQIYSFWAFDL